MNLLTPLAGAILAAAVIPPLLLLYFLRLRRKPIKIASTLLWEHATEDLRANAPFQRLRPSLLLFLQLLVLLFLALAIMQPQLAGAERTGGRTILLIDTSASMNATDGDGDGATRLEIARERAKDRIESLYAGGLFKRSNVETMVIAFGERAEVSMRFSRSRDDLLRAIDRVRPTDGGSHLEEALQLARAYMTNTDPEANIAPDAPAYLEVFSDGGLDDLDRQVLRGELMTYHRIGQTESSNASVTTVSVTRPFSRPGAVEVFAGLETYDAEDVVTDVELLIDERILAVQEVTIPAGSVGPGGTRQPGRRDITFSPFDQSEGGVVRVRLVRDDALPADDVAQAILPPPKQLDVLLVTAGRTLAQPVLEGMPLRRLERITPVTFEQRYADVEDLDVDVVVIDGWRPDPASMPSGRYLSFGQPIELDGIESYGESEGQLVLRANRDHPVMRYVPTDELFVSRASLVQPSAEVEVLLRGTGGPLILKRRTIDHDVIMTTFSLNESNWPLQRSFVTFVFNALEFLGRTGEAGAVDALIPGDAIATRVGPTTETVAVERPTGEALDVKAFGDGDFSWGPVRRAGVYRLSWEAEEGPQDRAFAVNIGSARDRDIAPAPAIELASDTVGGSDADAARYTPLWPWAVGLCLFVLMLEWVVYTRKSAI
ncbi:MAG: VWA domain-containing protein [Phycisphaerales bacterium]